MSTLKKRNGAAVAAVGLGSAAAFGLLLYGLANKKESLIPQRKSKRSQAQRVSAPLPKDYMGVKLDLPDYYEELLSKLDEPKLLYKHFMTMLCTPRPSEKLDKIRAALKKTAQLLNVEYHQDEVGNVCLKKAACRGYESAPGVVIQCHMDMVCTSNKSDDCKVPFDFDNDPIEAYIDGGWLKAKNTTLGADDGIGVAAGLALMEHPNLVHGAIELLITADEETSMMGAIKLAKAPFLKNKILINVDSEEDHRICIGCAGGFNKHFTVNMNRVALKKTASASKVYEMNISGLCGGHTGIQIHLGRANAIQCIARILNYLVIDQKIEVQLVDIRGGNAMNAIPNASQCTVVVAAGDAEKYEQAVTEYWLNYVLPEFKDIENKMHMDSRPIRDFDFNAVKVCDAASTQRLVALMMMLPHGVVRMSPTVPGLVQTSIAFSMLSMEKNENVAKCQCFARSMSMNEMLELDRKLNSLAGLLGKNVNVEIGDCCDLFPGWDPVTSSPALESCKQAHVALFAKEADVYAVHAGLECGLIKDKYPEMDCISIGPHIKGAHSTDERLELSTVPGFYDWLVETVARIALRK
eukprot:CAMPEP_0197039982 /NCGR_PEP_ID=MMETSP1384-20130603/16731_1 /TAXON_ID=29189 /ORGANISM="Ammonia sp." /LENGTH=579 /DNA_ID=CAMNT_0042470659 /DNA_START=33 /DNA_END=1772 /DNA_ORIENTATION=-